MRTYAADDFEMINQRIGQLHEEAVPTCPLISTKKLHDCLRSPHRCPETCDNRGDWIGPQIGSLMHVTVFGFSGPSGRSETTISAEDLVKGAQRGLAPFRHVDGSLTWERG